MEKLNLHPLVLRILLQREIVQEEEIQKFLYGTLHDLPNPFLLPDMDRAVERLILAMGKREKILFFGDYDVDGITGTAQLQSFFREMGFSTHPLLPHRIKDGYGLTEKSVRRILIEKPDLLVTIDNGTKSKREISLLKENGIDVIVIDHHETPSESERPPVDALLNPKEVHSSFPERNIASAGLVFLLLMALRARCRERGISPLPNLKRYLDLAALGTIADIVPLTGTNRLLVKYGLEEIGQTSRIGLKALAESASVRRPVNVGSVSFRLAPRINAAGRLADPKLALDLLMAEESPVASVLASKLESLNRERQQIEETVLSEAIKMVERDQKDRKGIVVAGPGWHLGVVGIVAAKLTECFSRPAIVLALSEDGKEAKGSARTVPGFSVYRALKRIEEEMECFGGHDAAAGMTVRAENLERFAKEFDQSVQEEWDPSYSPQPRIDAVIPLSDITIPLVKDLTLLEPHGPGNPEPVFMSSSVQLNSCRIVGSKGGKGGKGHLKATLCQGGSRIEAIGFNLGPYLESSSKNSLHNVRFFPQFNYWNGEENIQVKIKSINLTN